MGNKKFYDVRFILISLFIIILIIGIFLIVLASKDVQLSSIPGQANDCPERRCFSAETNFIILPKNLLDMGPSEISDFQKKPEVIQAINRAKEQLQSQVNSAQCPQRCSRVVSPIEESTTTQPENSQTGKCKKDVFSIDITETGKYGSITYFFVSGHTKCQLALTDAVEKMSAALKRKKNEVCGKDCDMIMKTQKSISPDCFNSNGDPNIDNAETVTLRIWGTGECVEKPKNGRYQIKFIFKQCVDCIANQAPR